MGARRGRNSGTAGVGIGRNDLFMNVTLLRLFNAAHLTLLSRQTGLYVIGPVIFPRNGSGRAISLYQGDARLSHSPRDEVWIAIQIPRKISAIGR